MENVWYLRKYIYIQWNIFVFNEKCFYFILLLYSPYFFIFLFSTNMQWTAQWFQIRNLVCKLNRYPGYDDEIYMIWSCFCYKSIINSIPGIPSFTWEITIFILWGSSTAWLHRNNPLKSVVQALYRQWCALKALTEM